MFVLGPLFQERGNSVARKYRDENLDEHQNHGRNAKLVEEGEIIIHQVVYEWKFFTERDKKREPHQDGDVLDERVLAVSDKPHDRQCKNHEPDILGAVGKCLRAKIRIHTRRHILCQCPLIHV